MYGICTLLSSFGQKMYGPKVLNILPFQYFGSIFFSRCFDNSVRAFFILFGQEGLCWFYAALSRSHNGYEERYSSMTELHLSEV